MSTPSPGPYLAHQRQIVDADGVIVGRCFEETLGVAMDKSFANARLFAASWEMAQTLEWVATIAEKEYELDRKLRANGARTLLRLALSARAALAKARGEG